MATFKETLIQSKKEGLKLPSRPTIQVPDANETFHLVMEHYVPGYTPLPEYDQVTEWLHDSKGKGLALIGDNGRGKSIIATKVIPDILRICFDKHMTVIDETYQINKRLDELLKYKFLSIDDIGTEDQLVDYGSRRWAFSEIMDTAEKKLNFIVLSANLDANSVEARYGRRTRERVRATCKVIVFNGESYRK